MRILAFSGGKDSLACLYLLEKEWHDLTVVWVNTGAYFEEDLQRIESIRKMVPNFIEIITNQAKQVEENGYPVDLLPVRHDRDIQTLVCEEKPKLQSFLRCCASNISMPLHDWAIKNGVTEIIRGQKNADKLKGIVRDGDVIDGIKYTLPIQEWTHQQVREYLGDRLPKHYDYVGGGLDCWTCTAYLHENQGKMRYIKEHHPEKYREVNRRLRQIKIYIDEEYKHLENSIKE